VSKSDVMLSCVQQWPAINTRDGRCVVRGASHTCETFNTASPLTTLHGCSCDVMRNALARAAIVPRLEIS